jgi:hypothetical protein
MPLTIAEIDTGLGGIVSVGVGFVCLQVSGMGVAESKAWIPGFAGHEVGRVVAVVVGRMAGV